MPVLLLVQGNTANRPHVVAYQLLCIGGIAGALAGRVVDGGGSGIIGDIVVVIGTYCRLLLHPMKRSTFVRGGQAKVEQIVE